VSDTTLADGSAPGLAFLKLVDPDGNPALIVQHVASLGA
jgi:hypothetical protein